MASSSVGPPKTIDATQDGKSRRFRTSLANPSILPKKSRLKSDPRFELRIAMPGVRTNPSDCLIAGARNHLQADRPLKFRFEIVIGRRPWGPTVVSLLWEPATVWPSSDRVRPVYPIGGLAGPGADPVCCPPGHGHPGGKPSRPPFDAARGVRLLECCRLRV